MSSASCITWKLHDLAVARMLLILGSHPSILDCLQSGPAPDSPRARAKGFVIGPALIGPDLGPHCFLHEYKYLINNLHHGLVHIFQSNYKKKNF